MDFVKDYEEFYGKRNEHFKDKVRKDYLWERLPASQRLQDLV